MEPAAKEFEELKSDAIPAFAGMTHYELHIDMCHAIS